MGYEKNSALNIRAGEGRRDRIMDSTVYCSGTMSSEYISKMVSHTLSKAVAVGVWGR